MSNQEQWVTRVRNLDCEHDARAIERHLMGQPGILRVDIYPRTAKVVVHYDPQHTTLEALRQHLETAGFPPASSAEIPRPPKPWENPRVLSSVLAGLLLLAAWIGQRMGWPVTVVQGLLVASMASGMFYFGREALEGLWHERRVGIELLMTVAALASAALGEWFEGATLVFLYSIAEALESYTEDKTRAAIRALMSLAPKVALVRRDGQEVTIPVEEIQVGDIFIVKPGQSVPTDGTVMEGRGYVDESPITGESAPVPKQPGDMVLAGSVNQDGVLIVRASKTAAENTLARMIAMVEEAQRRKGQHQQFVERFGRRYSPAVLLLGVVIALAPPLLWGAPWVEWIRRGTVFIVAAAPCALVIGVPLTFVASLGTAARRGVLVKGGIYMEELARVRVIAMDKTGTLTRGRPRVTDVLALNGASQEEVLALAASVEVHSEHPLAGAIVEAAEHRGLTVRPASHIQALPGQGIQGQWNGRHVLVGRAELFNEVLPSEATQRIRSLQAEGKTVVVVGVGDDSLDVPQGARPIGLIALRDEPRPEAQEMLADLHRLGVRVAMLTGDHPDTAQAIARMLGIDEVHAGLKPEDKVERVRALRNRYQHVAMVGDGVNDAPAMAEASVGIAMGAAGTDVAMETADVVLMADDLKKVPYALQLARYTQRIMWQNVVFAIAVVLALSAGALAGLFTLSLAVLVHELSEFVVVGNALRLLRA